MNYLYYVIDLIQEKKIEDYDVLLKHQLWYEELKAENEITNENVDDILSLALTKKFVNVLEDAGVFKMNDEGIDSFIHFVESMEE